MNEFTLIQLKIIVERVVRPVRASMRRKRKMREELLAHVTSVFAEESAALGEEQAALERTALRFGKPVQLTSELQQSIPASDRIRRFLDGQPGESNLHAAVRLAALTTTLALVIFVAILCADARIKVWPIEAVLLSAMSLLTMPLYMFSLVFLADWMTQALYGPQGRSRLKMTLAAVGSWLVTSIFAGGMAVLPLVF